MHHPHHPHHPCLPPHPSAPQAFAERAKAAKASGEPLATSIPQFYQTDAISRASKVMAKCIKVRSGRCMGAAGHQLGAKCRVGSMCHVLMALKEGCWMQPLQASKVQSMAKLCKC